MNGLLEINPLKLEQLNAVVELDRLCLGGLWTREVYQRELASPNSRLLSLSRTAELSGREQGSRGAEGQRGRGKTSRSIPLLGTSAPPHFLTPHSASPQLIGISCFWSILEEAHITILGVNPDYQGKGLGQLLLCAILQDAVRCQLERATLEVRVSNRTALYLYEKFGFKQAGRRRGYYKNPQEDALILWRGDLDRSEFHQMLTNWYQQVCDRIFHDQWRLRDSRWDSY
ncbi:MAG: ribosomal-protein-alanine N-acetyltransferase [Cyanobacteria bacterium QS_4_48_99]|nr:MAG: ribosomal-protein-alanine N-acetyltransferase [Cyanobacteria bacterium QS_4_48_99]